MSLEQILLGATYSGLQLVIKGEAIQRNKENIGFHKLQFDTPNGLALLRFETLLFSCSADDIVYSGKSVGWPYSKDMVHGNGLYLCKDSSIRELFFDLTGMPNLQHFVYQDPEYYWQFIANGVVLESTGRL